MRRMRAAEWTADGEKICPDCQTPKSPDEFLTSAGTRITYCKECSGIRAARWRAENPEKYRAKTRRRVLRSKGITEAEYEFFLAEQRERCAICWTDSAGGRWNGNFFIDHDGDHCPGVKSCGKCIRGLLCSKCNTAIGALNHNPEALRRAADYIENFREDNQELFFCDVEQEERVLA